MQIINSDFVIDMAQKMSFKYLQTNQYDNNSRKYRIIIVNRNVPVNLTGKEYIVLSLFQNGENYSNTPCLFEDDGYPYITFTESMLSKYGQVDCQLKIFDNIESTVATTARFQMDVEKSLLNYDRIVRSSEFNFLNHLIMQAIAIQDLLKEFEIDKRQVEAQLRKINSDIATYQQNYTDLSGQAQSLIDEVQEFLNTVQANETVRIAAENERVISENKRAKAESDRQNGYEAKTLEVETRTTTALSNMQTAYDNKVIEVDAEVDDAVSRLNIAYNNKVVEVDTEVNNAITNMQNAFDAKESEVETRVATAIENSNSATQEAITAKNNAEKAITDTNEATDRALQSAADADSAKESCLIAIENLKQELITFDGGTAITEDDQYDNVYDSGGA